MRHTDIRVGDTLKLKSDHPYDAALERLQTVTAIVQRGSYKVPWIYTQDGAFRPSDFQGRA